MNTLKINNTISFYGSREIVIKEMFENGNKIKKPIQEMLSQSQLRMATDALMQDLNGTSQEVKEVVMENLSKSAEKAYKTTSEKLNGQKIEKLHK